MIPAPLQARLLTVALLAMVAAWAWAWRRDRAALATAAISLLAAGAILLAVAPEAIPLPWLTPLQEGSSDVLLRLARGEGAHAGPVWHRALRGLGARDVVRLDQVVVANVAMTAAAALGWLAWASRRAGVVGAAAAAAVFASPPVRFAALSEGPAPAAWVLLLVAVTAAARATASTAGRVAWLLAVAGLAGVRVELAVLGLAAGLGPMGPLRVRGWAVAAWLGWGVVAHVAFTQAWGALGAAGWVALATTPQDPSRLALPVVLLATFGPGVTVLALVGGWRRPIAGAAGLLLFGTYHAAAHGSPVPSGFGADRELLRYLGLVAPWLIHLASEAGLRRPAWSALALVPGAPALLMAWPWSTAHHEGSAPWPLWGPLTRDAQVEVRQLVALWRDDPSCDVLSRGEDGTWWRAEGRRGPTFPSVTATDEVRPGCTWRVEGLGCASGGCPEPPPTAAAREVTEGPYGHPDHGWWTAPYTLRWWRVDAP